MVSTEKRWKTKKHGYMREQFPFDRTGAWHPAEVEHFSFRNEVILRTVHASYLFVCFLDLYATFRGHPKMTHNTNNNTITTKPEHIILKITTIKFLKNNENQLKQPTTTHTKSNKLN